MRKIISLSILVQLSFLSCDRKTEELSAQDIKDIQEKMSTYRASWIKGDSEEILDNISSDIILFMPTKTGKPVIGKQHVAEFWFPESDITYPIISYEVTNSNIGGSNDFAYYQGISRMKWYTSENAVAKDTTTSVSEFTTLLKKENSDWKIFSLMYNLKEQDYRW